LVADRVTQASFDPAEKMNAEVGRAVSEAGLMCWPMGGTIDRQRGDHLLLAPPYTIDASHVDAIVGGLAGERRRDRRALSDRRPGRAAPVSGLRPSCCGDPAARRIDNHRTVLQRRCDGQGEGGGQEG
jgi:hypothetical protein